jgi:hypothetical protein
MTIGETGVQMKASAGSAFPGSYTGPLGLPVWSDGMTLLDWFASQVEPIDNALTTNDLAAMLGIPDTISDSNDWRVHFLWWAEAEARYKYERAAAMMRVREVYLK